MNFDEVHDLPATKAECGRWVGIRHPYQASLPDGTSIIMPMSTVEFGSSHSGWDLPAVWTVYGG